MRYSVYWQGIQRNFQYSPVADRDIASYRSFGTEYDHILQLYEQKIPRGIYDGKKLLAESIRDGVGNSFVIILTPDQEPSFHTWIKDNKLEDNILYQMDKYTKNGNYWNQPPRLKLIYMSNLDHPMLDMFNDEEESEESNED